MVQADVAVVRRPFGSMRSDRTFFTGIAIVATLTVIVGFSPTFFLRPASDPPLTWWASLHGFVFTAWMVAYLLQSVLILVRRRDLHRTLGLVFTGLGAVMVVLGVKTAVEAVRRGAGAAPDLDPRAFMVIPFFDILLFAGFLAAGYVWRRSPEAHKRLMLLATIDVAGPAIARIAMHSQRPLFADHFPMWGFAGMMLLIATGAVYDAVSRRRVHPAYWWGAIILTASGPTRFALGATSGWLAFVDWLLRWA